MCNPMKRSKRYKTPPPSPSLSAPPSPIEAHAEMAARRGGQPSTPGTQQEQQGEARSPIDRAKVNLMERFFAKYRALEGKRVEGRLPRNQLKCNICEREFPTNAQLQRHHMKVHQGGGNWACSECEKVFLSRVSLDAHVASIHQDKGFVCEEEECGKRFGTKRALKSHHQRFHVATEGPFTCEFCTKEFNMKKDQKAHQDSCRHNPDRLQIKCPDCSRYFSQKKHLNKHLRDEH